MSTTSVLSMFWNACQSGDCAKVEGILDLCPDLDLNWENPLHHQITALLIACWEGHNDVVEFLLRQPTLDPNRRNMIGQSPFFIACLDGHFDIAKMLLQDPRVQVTRRKRSTWVPLHAACHHGRPDTVRLLLGDPRVDPNEANDLMRNPIHTACAMGHQDVVQLLVQDLRTDLNSPTALGMTPLHEACKFGGLLIVKMLLASSALIDTQKRTSQEIGNLTAIDLAQTRTDPGLAEVIEQYQLNPDRTRKALRQELGWVSPNEHLFAQIVFMCDDLLQLKEEEEEEEEVREENPRRFFWIVRQLPLELQMVLANRSYGLATNLIPHRDRELAFRDLARVC